MISSQLQWILCFLMVSSWVVLISGRDWMISTERMAEAHNYFGRNLYHKLRGDSRGNLIFSPLSLSLALGMLLHGARGRTSAELNRVLGYAKGGFADNNETAVSQSASRLIEVLTISDDDLDIASRILLKDSFEVKGGYVQDMLSFFKSELKRVNFERDSREIIRSVNRWVETLTKGNIRSLVSYIDPRSVMIIINAVYFKGLWRKPFPTRSTQVLPFYNQGHRETRIPLMNTWIEMPYSTFGTYSAVEIPYKGDAAMLVLLPKENDGLSTLESEFRYSDLLDSTRSALRKNLVNLTLPKFDLDYSGDLIDALEQLGLESVFSNEADFSGISTSKRIKVTQVLHKATVSVDEKGTVATAATAVGGAIGVSGSRPKLVQFHVDHPFMFAIVERMTGMVMFLGKVKAL